MTHAEKRQGIDVQPLLSQLIKDNAAMIAQASNVTYEEVVAAADAALKSYVRVRMMDLYQRSKFIDPRKDDVVAASAQ